MKRRPRWLKRMIAASAEFAPLLPWRRGARGTAALRLHPARLPRPGQRG